MDKRVTNKDRQIALVWDYLRRANAPVEVMSAFRALAIPHIVQGTKDNEQHWQPVLATDEYLED